MTHQTSNHKKFLASVGMVLIVFGLIFFIIFPNIMTSDPIESFPRDLLGFTVPHPPMWTSYIPYLGWLLEIIFSIFSLHGLVYIVALIISAIPISVGIKLLDRK